MSDAERAARMKRMRRVVREENVFWWVDSFLRVGAKVTAQSVRRANRLGARLKKTPNDARPT
jgi:trehalose-6-phosphate synthase